MVSSVPTTAVLTTPRRPPQVWELHNGRVCTTLVGVGASVLQLRLLPQDDGVLFTSERRSVRVWSLTFVTCLRVIDSYCDPATICLADNGSLLVAIFQG